MKLRTTNYQETGLAHDDIGLHAPVPFLKQPLRPPSAASSPIRGSQRDAPATCDLRDALWASPTPHFITSFWTEVMALEVASSKSLE